MTFQTPCGFGTVRKMSGEGGFKVRLAEQRLYYNDSYGTDFQASVLESVERDGMWHLRLDQSAFYPTSGGQPHDTGWIEDARVSDVYVQEEQVIHVVDKPVAVGTQVNGRIDWDRRFDHMQHHTGQHILSACFEQLLNVDTIGFHLGEEAVTIDLADGQLDVQEINQVERQANVIVWENRLITANFVETEELSRLTLRHPPKVAKDIRIVSIANFDHNACGGTHVRHTGELGIIKVLRTERMRGGTRLTFACGNRARQDFEHRLQVLREVGRQLSTGSAELSDAITKLQQTAVDSRKLADAWKTKWFNMWAVNVVFQHLGGVVPEVPEVPDAGAGAGADKVAILATIVEDLSESAELKQAAVALTDALAATGVANAGVAVVAQIGPRIFVQAVTLGNERFDAHAAIRNGLMRVNGKGGGSRTAAQGSFPFSEGLDLAQVTGWLESEFAGQARG